MLVFRGSLLSRSSTAISDLNGPPDFRKIRHYGNETETGKQVVFAHGSSLPANQGPIVTR
jgi:hypothetical protein